MKNKINDWLRLELSFVCSLMSRNVVRRKWCEHGDHNHLIIYHQYHSLTCLWVYSHKYSAYCHALFKPKTFQWTAMNIWWWINSGTSQFVVLRCGSFVARSKQFERTVPLETGKETERPNSIALNYTQNKLWLFELATPRRGRNGILWIVESAQCRHHWQTMCLNFGGKLRSLDEVNGSRKWITKNTNENSCDVDGDGGDHWFMGRSYTYGSQCVGPRPVWRKSQCDGKQITWT